MSILSEKCQYYANKLHAGVSYGSGMDMAEQVKGTASLVSIYSTLSGYWKEVVVSAAYLHKCFDAKRIKEGVSPLTMEQVEKIGGPDVRKIVEELSTEPETKGLSKTEQWLEKAAWAKTLSQGAQEILLAEKVLNFQISRDKPNPKKSLSWHKEYFETRMLMVNEIAGANRELSYIAGVIHKEAMMKINALLYKQRQFGNDGR